MIGELRQTTLPVEDALALLAHDMRSALAVIQGFALTLQEHWREMPETEVSASLRAIGRRSDYLLSFSDDLLDMSRAEAGRLTLERRLRDLAEVLDPVLERVRVAYPKHRFTVRAHHAPLCAWIDGRRVGQVIANLLENAARSAPPGTEVEIDTHATDGGIAVTVRDHGPGILPEVRTNLFEKFPHRAGARGTSIGLGLYLCRLLIETHRGRIWVESSENGTVFGFLVPATAGGLNP